MNKQSVETDIELSAVNNTVNAVNVLRVFNDPVSHRPWIEHIKKLLGTIFEQQENCGFNWLMYMLHVFLSFYYYKF